MVAAAPSFQTLPPPLSVIQGAAPMPRELRRARVLDVFIEQCLALDAADARQLQKHFGWMPEASVRLGVRSAPSRTFSLVACSELRRIVGDSEEWPAGFYTEAGGLRFDLERSHGLVIPVWRKWPAGLMYYRHAKDERPRWITSASRPTGAAAAASIHAHPMKARPAEVERVFVVDHTLRAMAVSMAQGVSCVAFNGASVPAAPAQIFEAFPRLRGAVMALSEAHPRLERELRDAGLNVTNWRGGELI